MVRSYEDEAWDGEIWPILLIRPSIDMLAAVFSCLQGEDLILGGPHVAKQRRKLISSDLRTWKTAPTGNPESAFRLRARCRTHKDFLGSNASIMCPPSQVHSGSLHSSLNRADITSAVSVDLQILSNDMLMPVFPLIAISTRVANSPAQKLQNQYLPLIVKVEHRDMTTEQFSN